MVQVKLFGKRVRDTKPNIDEQMNKWFAESDITPNDIVDIHILQNGEGYGLAINAFIFYNERQDD